jgi:uncharacterized protein (UPF0261 family)/ABC-type branched-subunit amino acid transport system ATPase component
MSEGVKNPALEVRGLNLFYGASHALQGVDLTLIQGVLSIVGRNGMGKTTLCKAIMGLLPITSGSVAIHGQPISGGEIGTVARMGVGYVPQGRRLWPSLTVDEHLKMLEKSGGSWSIERIYDVFPRLANRKSNGGGQLSGGEQQMLAIARALLQNPKILIMDEPTEGLAPVIVDQVAELLITLSSQREMDILVVEQNIRVATAVSDQVAIMLNGKIERLIDATRLAADQSLQQSLLGVGRLEEGGEESEKILAEEETRTRPDFIYAVNDDAPHRWSKDLTEKHIRRQARAITTEKNWELPKASDLIRANPLRSGGGIVIVAGTMDTKARELRFVRDILRKQGVTVRLADLSLRSSVSGADIPAYEIATSSFDSRHSLGDRVSHMAEAFATYIRNRPDVAGMIALGGSGGSAIVAPALQELPVGVPKILVTTMAAGDISAYVGGSDVTVIPAVADIQGLNRITGKILSNAAHALAGMVSSKSSDDSEREGRSIAAFTMFGITTPCVQALTEKLHDIHECLTFHATGAGGRAMESLVAEGQVNIVYDMTTTEIADEVVGGILSAGSNRLDIFSRVNIPYIGAAGALDAVNFGPPETIPETFKDRLFYNHNPQVTLMRTSVAEAHEIGLFVAKKLNAMAGAFRFFLPEGGLSALDIDGGAFQNKEANEELFSVIEKNTAQGGERQIIRIGHHINSPEFAKEVLLEVGGMGGKQLLEENLSYG